MADIQVATYHGAALITAPALNMYVEYILLTPPLKGMGGAKLRMPFCKGGTYKKIAHVRIYKYSHGALRLSMWLKHSAHRFWCGS